MKTYNDLYETFYSNKNLIVAWKKARKGKTKRDYIKKFEEHFRENILQLKKELQDESYKPSSLTRFVIRDPKTRKISRAEFRDRIVHHALVRVIEPIFDPRFIYDSCANRKGKGSLFAIQRLEKFIRRASKNNTLPCFILKADIKHYFDEINHEILMKIIRRKIADEKIIALIEKILIGGASQIREMDQNVGMPLGNLTSQFFANVYLNEFDYFVKHELKVSYYIRYVDDFVLIHQSKPQLEKWKQEINHFLGEKLKIELHPDKSRIISLSRGVDFVGFRNFYHYKLLRKRNIKTAEKKIKMLNKGKLSYERFIEIFQGWNAYAQWANTHNCIIKLIKKIKV